MSIETTVAPKTIHWLIRQAALKLSRILSIVGSSNADFCANPPHSRGGVPANATWIELYSLPRNLIATLTLGWYQMRQTGRHHDQYTTSGERSVEAQWHHGWWQVEVFRH